MGRRFYLLVALLVSVLLYATLNVNHTTQEPTAENHGPCASYAIYYEKVFNIPDGLLRAIATQESSLRPWTLNVGGKPYYFNTKKEAVDKVLYYQSIGVRSIDVGCMQINLRYHGKFLETPGKALNPKRNVLYSAQHLSKLHRRHKDWRIAVARYHVGTISTSEKRSRGERYVRKVYNKWFNLLSN